MRKILLVLAVGLLSCSCVFGVGFQGRHAGAGVQVGHAHCRGCGHVFVNGVWMVAR